MASSRAFRRVETPTSDTRGQKPRPRRADARKNQERVLAAADQVFAAQGMTASTEEVARVAGVGIGTVFRHFPTKEALLEAVLISRLQRFLAEARKLAASPDPGQAFFTLFVRATDQSPSRNAAAAALAAAGIEVAANTGPVMAEMRHTLSDLLTRAQEAGAVRTDVGVDEVVALLIGTVRAAELTGSRSVLEQMVRVICDGLQPPGTR